MRITNRNQYVNVASFLSFRIHSRPRAAAPQVYDGEVGHHAGVPGGQDGGGGDEGLGLLALQAALRQTKDLGCRHKKLSQSHW